jgi:hypothetical protein
MANIFRAKSLISRTGVFSNEVVAPNILYNTGDQKISGIKDFASRPTVNGTGVLLSGEAASLPVTIVYVTGDQTISGTKTFDISPIVSGNPLITGNLSLYATTTNLASTGSTLNNSINSLSGSLNSSGINLTNRINLLSGVSVLSYGNQNITGNKTFINNIEVQGTGIFNALDLSNISEFNFSGTNINLISGNVNVSGQIYISGNPVLTGVNLSSYATTANLASTGNTLATNLASTGSTLVSSINSLSGLFTGFTGNLDATFASDTQLASTGSTLQTNINNLSGVAVLTFGNQTISGIKSFEDSIKTKNIISSDNENLLISGYSSAMVKSDINIIPGKTSFSKGSINLTAAGDQVDGNINFKGNVDINNYGEGDSVFTDVYPSEAIHSFKIYKSGINSYTRRVSYKSFEVNQSGVYTLNKTPIYADAQIYISGNPVSTGVDLSSYATTSNLALTGLNLSNNINSLSGLFTGFTGTLDATFATDIQLFNTGSTLNNKINSLSGVSVLTYGNQNISGTKNFIDNVNFSGTGTFNAIDLNNIDNLSLSGVDVTLTDSIINVNRNIFISGNPVLTGINLTPYATTVNLALTGSTLSTNLGLTGSTLVGSINSLSGLFTGYTGNLDSTFASDIQLFNTGVTLNNTITSLSGTLTGDYVTKSNGLFTNTPTVNGTNILLSGEAIISGDLTGYLPYPTVNKLQGYKLDLNGGAADGQVLQWNAASSSWRAGAVPAGGNGGGGLVYYFDFANRSGIAPTGGLPTTGDHALSLLGREYAIGSGQAISNELDPRFVERLLCSFVTASGNPQVTNIPAGLWDFNVWASVDSASAIQCSIRAVVNIYNPNNSTYRYLASTDNVYLYETDTIAQYILNATVPQTGIQSYERIYIELFGKKYTTNNRTITLYFDSYRPSHVHTTIPSIAGDGVVKVVNGVFQSPATGIFDADVDNAANIAQSKIANLSSDLTTIRNTGTALDTKIGALSGTLTNNYLTTSSASTTYATIANLASTGSTLDTKINTLSGYVTGANATFASITNLANTGSTLNTRINNLSGYINSTSSNIVFTTGNQTISGVKTFVENATFGDTGQGDFLVISGNNFTVYGSGNFTSGLFVNGNAVLTGVNLTPYATTANLALTGNTLTNNITSLSGLFTGYTGALDATYATDTQLFTTGSTLQTNINNLSGYVNSTSSNILFTTGNQIISGLKTFNTGLSTTYISGVSGISLNILGYSDSISAQTLRNINITAGLGTSTINAGDIILIGGNLSGVAPNILKTGASITIGGAKTSATADITIKPSIDQNGAAGNIVLEAGASTTYNGKINMFGDININGTLDGGTALSSKNINIYRRGDFFGSPSQRLAVSIDNNNVNFQNGMGLQVSGVQVTPALYATSANLASTGSTLATNIANTGSTLQTNINNLSNTYATITNLASTGSTLATNLANTGSTLNSNIISLSGLFTGYTGTLDNTYATDIQLFNTGSTLQTNINNLSSTYATITNVGLTGSTLTNNITSLSGLFTGYTGNLDLTFATDLQVLNTGITLNTRINNLSGVSVLTYGNQNIGGNKTFTGVTTFSGQQVNLVDTALNLSGVGDMTFEGTNINFINSPVFISGTNLRVVGDVIGNNLVYNTGNQTISGIKTFASRPTVNGTGVLLSGDIPYVQTNSYFYVDATRTDSYIENGNILYPYKTLSGAYNAAKNIAHFHNPTYITLLSPIAENLTIDKGYINLVGNNTNKNDPIRITGSLVFAATGIGSTITDNNFSIAGLGVTATSNNKCILFSGNNPQRLFIQDCWLIAKDNGTCLYSNNTNTTSRLQGDILKLSPEGVNTTAIDIVSGTSSISFAETSSSASVLAYVRNNSTLNISNSQIETTGAKAFQVENTARLTLLNSVLTNTANPSTGIFLDASSTAVVVGSAISVPANANSYAINGVANSYLFYKNLYFSIDANGGSTESKIGNNVNKNLINSYDPVVYSIGDQTISGVKTFDVFPIVSGNKLITGVDLSSYLTSFSASSTYSTITNLASTGSTLDTKINNLSGYVTGTNATFASVTNLANTGSNLDTKINNLSGYLTGITGTFGTSVNSLNANAVFITGNQIISGIKTFASRPTVNSTGILFSGEAAPKDIGTTINISSNTISLDLSTFSYFLVNLNNNITTTNFNNPKAAPEVTNFVLQLSGDGTIRSVTWPTSLRWPGSTAPIITIGPNKVDTYSIFSYDGGVSYYGFPAGYNS